MTIHELQAKATNLQRMRHWVRDNYVLLRRVRGLLPQSAIAQDAGVRQSYVSYVENGITYGIGEKALRRVLTTYSKLLENVECQ